MKFDFKKGPWMKFLLIMLAVSFVLSGVIGFLGGIGEGNIIKIDKKRIGANNFIRYLNNKKSQYFTQELTQNDLNFINSKEFVYESLREFISMDLLQYEIEKLKLKEPRDVIFENIYNDARFKGSDGVFNITTFRNMLEQSGITEDYYIEYIGMVESQSALLNLIMSLNLNVNSVVKKITEKENKYATVDIVSIPQTSLKFTKKTPTDEEIQNYYEENSEKFLVPEEKIISFIEINLSKNTNDSDITTLQDATLVANNMDELAKKYNAKKQEFSYIAGKTTQPEDMNSELLEYGAGTFSDLIYKGENTYKIYYIENVIPTRTLELAEVKAVIAETLSAENTAKNEMEVVENLIREMKKDGIANVAKARNFNVESNKKVYRNEEDKMELVQTTFSIKDVNSFGSPYFDSNKKEYKAVFLKSIHNIEKGDPKYISEETIGNRLDKNYKNSVYKTFQNYLYDSNKIIVNYKLLDSIN